LHLHSGVAFQVQFLLLHQHLDHLQAVVVDPQEEEVVVVVVEDGSYTIRSFMLTSFNLIAYLLLYQQFYQKLFHPKAQEFGRISYSR